MKGRHPMWDAREASRVKGRLPKWNAPPRKRQVATPPRIVKQRLATLAWVARRAGNEAERLRLARLWWTLATPAERGWIVRWYPGSSVRLDPTEEAGYSIKGRTTDERGDSPQKRGPID